MSGSLWLVPGEGGKDRTDDLPDVPRPRRPHWAAPDPVDELAARMGDLIAAAVHPDEIAAVIESDGMSDDQIRLTYGRENSFALAEELYARVPRSYPEPERAVTDPWRVSLLGCLLRALVFALPGLAYVVGSHLLSGPPDARGLPAGTMPLLAGALAGWVWNQALAHRAYSWLGLGARRAAARALAVGAPLGALAGAAVAWIVGSADADAPGSVAFAAGQAAYLGAATTLLVFGRERWLLCALAPVALGAALMAVYVPPDAVRAALLVLSLGAAVALAAVTVLRCRREPRQDGPAPRAVASVPYGIFGLAIGVLVLLTALGDVLRYGAHAEVAAPAAVALTLSMGPAEWLLYRYRSRAVAGLRASTTPAGFWRATSGALARCLASYLAVLALLGGVGSLLWRQGPPMDAAHGLGLLCLGVVLWTALLLQAFGAVPVAAAVCGPAAAAQTVVLVTGPVSPAVAQLTVCGAAGLVLAAVGSALLGRATAHR
ncbi:hypothetical protein [Streptomyces paromomycinus]|uniref:Uncharacterized protein n=1 Tax=Streptomyces paromomycinus TaxID=92743 RepID=A0A401WAS8_STREY|nr:hypothetical protein [Streptomyces paromomycinus]GCD46379.1 hypothetical protein GKJPGBOP_06128 [Streptomyces paromomycinus]